MVSSDQLHLVSRKEGKGGKGREEGRREERGRVEVNRKPDTTQYLCVQK